MNLGIWIALSAAAANLSMAAMHFATSRAPGWRIGRLFAAIAFTAGLYNIQSVIFCIASLPDATYLATGRFTYLIGTLHAALWFVYAYADHDGSLRKAPRQIRWLTISVMAITVTTAITGGLLKPHVEVVRVGWAGVEYHYPLTTTVGDIYGLLAAGLLAWVFLRLIIRFRRGERDLRWQLAFFGLFFLCAVDEVLVANRMWNSLSLLDVGFLLVVMPLSWQSVRRIIEDARRLHKLSNHLEQEVVRRTEERDLARRALADSEQHVQNLVSKLEAIVWEADPETMKLTFVSEGAQKLLGYPREEWLQGKEFWARHLHHEDRERTIAEVNSALLSKSVVSVEYRMLAADGRVRWLRDFIHPVEGSNGYPERIRGIIVDITESRGAHEALLESEERFRSLANTAPVIIWLTDATGNATFFNRQAATFSGRTFEQLSGQGWLQLLHPEDVDRVTSSQRTSLEVRRLDQMKLRLLRADGQYRWMLMTAVPRFSGAEFAGHIGTIVDITELKRDEEQLLASQKLESLGVLASGIAHDFNNLLGSILADSELVAAELDGAPQAHECIARIRRVAMRAAEIVRELMVYAGQETAEFKLVDLNGLIAEMLQLLSVSISKHARLEMDLAQNLPAIRANAAEVRQVVMNLVTNASEAIGERDGVVRVATSRLTSSPDPPGPESTSSGERDYVCLEIDDSGCGMSEEIRAKIFDPFFTTKFPGRGLGLAAVQGIVRTHGGAIHVVSTPRGGTRFRVLFPTATELARDEPRGRAAAPPVERDASKGTVLLVEDEESLRIPVARLLRKNGFTVCEAEDGCAAAELFRSSQQDIRVVLLDLTLPGLGGKDVLAELRRVRSDVKVILTTAYSQENAMRTLGDLEVWRFIRKPYRLGDLITLLREALRE